MKTNAVNHKCDKYELVHQRKATPVLRRGGNFVIDLKLNKIIDLKKKDVMKLYFNFGEFFFFFLVHYIRLFIDLLIYSFFLT